MCVCVCVGVSVWSIRFFNDGQRGIARSFTRFVPGRKKIRGVGGGGGKGGGRRRKKIHGAGADRLLQLADV